MKSCYDVTNELKYFFKLAVRYNIKVQNTNDLKWIILFEETGKKEKLGISQEGQWIFSDEEKFYELKEKKMFLYCVKLLEISYLDIKASVEKGYKELLSQENICISLIFPFFQIVEFAFSTLLDDYWFDLAWMWYENLNSFERNQLIGQLETISETKKMSQRNRQKAKREALVNLQATEFLTDVTKQGESVFDAS